MHIYQHAARRPLHASENMHVQAKQPPMSSRAWRCISCACALILRNMYLAFM